MGNEITVEILAEATDVTKKTVREDSDGATLVVGGLVVSFIVNADLPFLGGKSVVDAAKDGLKSLADGAQDGAKKAWDWIGSRFW